MRLIIVIGLSGSGKSVALHVLEDLGYYCIDNMPAALLKSLLQEVTRTREQSGSLVAVGVDARNRKSDLEALPGVIAELRQNNIQTDLLFLQASDEILLKRYSETRRRHPLAADGLELRAAIARERELLDVLSMISQPKEIVHALGRQAGGRPVGRWVADNTEMIYPDPVQAEQVIRAARGLGSSIL